MLWVLIGIVCLVSIWRKESPWVAIAIGLGGLLFGLLFTDY